ncbi:MAG: hypothetical protein JNG85_09425 [Spirochaetaceae bacterium]|nr:hypothetical protein [Spirochaetaceae bacterium]
MRRKRTNKKHDVAVVAINLAILVGAACFLTVQDAAFKRREKTESLRENRFLTTEWRLMRELKERTDRELREKDREIAELNLRYRRFRESGSSSELLAAIEEEMRRAEAERQSILSSRIRAVAELPAPTATGSPASPPRRDAPKAASAAIGVAGSAETALSELLRRRITELEEALAASKAGAAGIERELLVLRREAAVPASPRTDPPLALPTVSLPAAEPAGGAEDVVGAALELLTREREALADPDSVLGVSDLKTRALLRAIVRTPAIRSEYPELLEALDRYLALSGKAEYLRGKREALDALAAVLEGGARGR